jgi:hypothetical protein
VYSFLDDHHPDQEPAVPETCKASLRLDRETYDQLKQLARDIAATTRQNVTWADIARLVIRDYLQTRGNR